MSQRVNECRMPFTAYLWFAGQQPDPSNTPPPSLFPIQLNDCHDNPVITEACVDIGLPVSFIRRHLFQQLGLPVVKDFQNFTLACSCPFTTSESTVVKIRLPDEKQPVSAYLHVVEEFAVPLLIGRRELALLPVPIKLDGKSLFPGFQMLQPAKLEPQLPVGEGIAFAGGDSYQRKLVTNVLTANQQVVYEWSGQLGMFRNHVASLPLKDSTPVMGKLFKVGPDKRGAFKQEIHDYLKKGYIKQSTSS